MEESGPVDPLAEALAKMCRRLKPTRNLYTSFPSVLSPQQAQHRRLPGTPVETLGFLMASREAGLQFEMGFVVATDKTPAQASLELIG